MGIIGDFVGEFIMELVFYFIFSSEEKSIFSFLLKTIVRILVLGMLVVLVYATLIATDIGVVKWIGYAFVATFSSIFIIISIRSIISLNQQKFREI